MLARQSATNEAAPTNSLIFGATFDITSFLPDGSKGTEEGDFHKVFSPVSRQRRQIGKADDRNGLSSPAPPLYLILSFRRDLTVGSRNGKKCANINGTRADEKEEEEEEDVGIGGIEHAPSSPLLYIGSSTGFSNRSDLHTCRKT